MGLTGFYAIGNDGPKFIQKFIGIVIFLFMPVYTAAVMIGASKFIQGSLGIDYNIALFLFAAIVAMYVFFGGLKRVMYSDAFQGLLMLTGMGVLIVAVYSKLGGITAAHQKLTDLMQDASVQEQVKGLQAGGFQGWTRMPVLFSQYWWIVVSSIVMGVGIGVLAQPQLAVRFMTVKSDREINRAVPVGGVFILMMTGVAFVVGALSNVFFFEATGQISIAAAGGADNIIPAFLDGFMPEWFMAVFLVVLLAAGMSTQYHAIGTAVGRDLFNTEGKDDKKVMLISKMGVLIAIVVTIVLAYVLPTVWNDAIAISTGLFFGMCGVAFLPIYFGALYIKKMTKAAAISGMMTGFGVSMLWMLFIHSKISKVLMFCQVLFGKETIAPEGTMWQFVDPIIEALMASILVTIVVQFCTKSKFTKEHVDNCFCGIGKAA